MSKSDRKQRTILHENVIHVGAGFAAKERPHVLEALSALASHLGRWDSRNVDVEVTLQDRGGKEQRVTLRTMLPGLPQLIAVGESSDITRALAEAKHELIRQLEHQKSAREPMSNARPRSHHRRPASRTQQSHVLSATTPRWVCAPTYGGRKWLRPSRHGIPKAAHSRGPEWSRCLLAYAVGSRRCQHVHWYYADALPSSLDSGRWSAIRGFSHEPTLHHPAGSRTTLGNCGHRCVRPSERGGRHGPRIRTGCHPPRHRGVTR
jgi:ribosome-associated translation inhibitor RaiA